MYDAPSETCNGLDTYEIEQYNRLWSLLPGCLPTCTVESSQVQLSHLRDGTLAGMHGLRDCYGLSLDISARHLN